MTPPIDPESAFALRSRRVVTPAGTRAATVRIAAGVIQAVDSYESGGDAEDLGDAWLIPGLVDTHVHVNEPGRTEWEGFHTATRAAAAGGITCLVDMPLNAIPATTTRAALDRKVDAARNSCHVDVGFWGGVVPGNEAELAPLAQGGVRGFKCFLSPSGVDEFENVGEAELEIAMPRIAALGLPLLAHAEWPATLDATAHAVARLDPRRHATWEASRPPAAEVEAIECLARLAASHGTRVHVVHVASGEAAGAVRAARRRGVAITAETCPHYLFFDAGTIPDGATEFKCAPPLRSGAQREHLAQALADATLSIVASDHSPCPPALKARDAGDFFAAWGGIASLEWSLAATWTACGAQNDGPPGSVPDPGRIEAVVRWMSAAPAELAGLSGHKGAIAPGRDADLVAWHPAESFVVDPAQRHQRHPVTPYAGQTLYGRIERTWLRGRPVFERGEFSMPEGRLLLEPSGALR